MGAGQPVRANLHDMSLIYYGWQISRAAPDILTGAPLIVEIGAGYGGMSAKFKDLCPGARCVLLDLPEVNCVQAHYLQARYPNARILHYRDVHDADGDWRRQDFDFAVLPGWMIETLPDGAVDLAVNVRSMMEMNPEIIDYYFDHIQRTVRPGGGFACMNRYVKGPPVVRIKDYPFDERWAIRLSQTSILQSHMHELILERTAGPQPFGVSAALRSLQPFDQEV